MNFILSNGAKYAEPLKSRGPRVAKCAKSHKWVLTHLALDLYENIPRIPEKFLVNVFGLPAHFQGMICNIQLPVQSKNQIAFRIVIRNER
jgi:hypothetical protein